MVRRARAQGMRVTCEVAPHHLILTDEEVAKSGFSTNTKMKPPLRCRARPRRPDPGPRRRHRGLHRERPRAAPPGREGRRVQPGAVRHPGPGDDAQPLRRPAGAAGHPQPEAADRAALDRTGAGDEPAGRHPEAGEPRGRDPVPPGRRGDDPRRRLPQQVPQHAVRRLEARAAGRSPRSWAGGGSSSPRSGPPFSRQPPPGALETGESTLLY